MVPNGIRDSYLDSLLECYWCELSQHGGQKKKIQKQPLPCRHNQYFFSACMLTNDCINTRSRSNVWAAMKWWFSVYFCCTDDTEIKWQHTFDGQNKYDFTQKVKIRKNEQKKKIHRTSICLCQEIKWRILQNWWKLSCEAIKPLFFPANDTGSFLAFGAIWVHMT